jgi:CubicO group peptidase (beta-lactamase class C family)
MNDKHPLRIKTPLTKREFLKSSLCVAATGYSGRTSAYEYSFNREKYGYPTYPDWNRSGRWNQDIYNVAKNSGGIEKTLPYNRIRRSDSEYTLSESIQKDISYGTGFSKKGLNEYLYRKPVTSLVVSKENKIIYENYGFDRTREMRMHSWSMAKSITAILLGICIDKKLIISYDDEALKYVGDLRNSYHGTLTIRNLSNMSSGADIIHEKGNQQIYPNALLNLDSNITKVVQNWNDSKEKQGTRFNYNELCALTVGLIIKSVTGQNLSQFAEEHLWSKIGASADATWITDSTKSEFNCIGFNAITRDWIKLGSMLVHNGSINGNQILSESWIKEMTTWGERDQQVKFGNMSRQTGYKCFLWHWRSDGSLASFNGAQGQRLLMDFKTKAVILQTAVDELEWMPELIEINDAIGKLSA